MKLMSKPTVINTALVMVKGGMIQVDYLPDDFSGTVTCGRVKIPNVMISDLNLPLGNKIDKLIFDEYVLYGVIPIYHNDITNITECIIDKFYHKQ